MSTWYAVWEFSTGKLLSLASASDERPMPEHIRNPVAPILYEVDADGNEVLDVDGNPLPQTDADGNPLRDPDWVQPYGYTEWADRNASGEFENEWNPTTKAFDIPKPPPEARLTRVQFMQRFTTPERIAIRTARATDPVVEDFMQMVELAEYISNQDPNLEPGLGYLAQQGLITSDRIAEIAGF